MATNEIERRLSAILRGSSGQLPEEQLREVLELVNAGEPGIALENYLTQLFEYDIVPPPGTLQELRTLGEAMGIEKKYWERLMRSGVR